jgi:serine phosphatase RsbU (regulator of sigma subunit)
MNLFVKLSIWSLGLVLLSTISFFIVSNREVKNLLEDQVFSEMEERAMVKTRSLARYFSEKEEVLKVASLHPILQNHEGRKGIDIRRHLQALNEKTKGFYSLSFFDVNRVRLADTRKKSEGEQHSYSRYWKKVRFDRKPNDPGNFLIDFSNSESLGEVVIHFTQVVFDTDSQPKGLLVGRVLLDQLLPVFEEDDPKFAALEGELHLLDSDWNYLYSSKNPVMLFGFSFPYKDQMRNQKRWRLKDKIFIRWEDQRQAKQLTPYSLIYEIREDKAYAPIFKVWTSSLQTLIGVLAIAGIVTLFLSRFLTEPIRKLSLAATRMAAGEPETTFLIRTGDELQTLSIQLQKMAQALQLKLLEQTKLSKELQLINQNITYSIQYASRIQNSILPPSERWNSLFEDHFILYQPRDIVSGDFYYLKKIGNTIFLAVADCTGHGVPGAFMSMVGYNGLVHLIEVEKLQKPSRILQELGRFISNIFPKDQEEQIFGMEIGLCVIDLSDKKLCFVGAGIDLVISNPAQPVRKLPGNKDEIASWKGEAPFAVVEHLVPLEQGWHYMSSDGFKDQLGGPKSRKFQSRAFEKCLQEISGLNGKEQFTSLKRTWKDWKKDELQTDDILVIGWKMGV